MTQGHSDSAMPLTREVTIGPLRIGGGRPFVFIGGPCVIESREHALRHAAALRAITERVGVPFVYKSSFDKANRTSLQSYRGPGVHAGLKILAAVKREIGVPVLTDVHEVAQVGAAAVRIAEEWRDQRKQLERVRSDLAGAAAKNLLEGATTVGNVKVVVRQIDGDMKDLMALSKEICEDPRAVALLAAKSAAGASLIVSRGADVSLDAREVLSEAVSFIGGKGGGREDFAQGAGPNVGGVAEALEVAMRRARERLSTPSG
jgi:hypothetical protein